MKEKLEKKMKEVIKEVNLIYIKILFKNVYIIRIILSTLKLTKILNL